MRIFCRVRPLLPGEENSAGAVRVHTSSSSVELAPAPNAAGERNGSTTFECHQAFDGTTSQCQVSEDISMLVQSAIDGYKVCIFAYGQTGSGKTFTMVGGQGAERGVIPRAAELIFSRCAELRSLGWTFDISISCLQVYNETLTDLLPVPKGEAAHAKELLIKSDGSVWGLRAEGVRAVDEVSKLLAAANANRHTRAHIN